jgi:hypothetical protein
MWDKELNRFYGELMNTLNTSQKQTLRAAQREWVQYRDAQKAAILRLWRRRELNHLAVHGLSKLQISRSHEAYCAHRTHGRGTCQEREIDDMRRLGRLSFGHD